METMEILHYHFWSAKTDDKVLKNKSYILFPIKSLKL